MSDEIDLEANNLCTTEDAFEKFQSVSMYEEDEYITLSDIVSSSQDNHDITEMFTDSLGNNDSTPGQIVQEEKYPETLLPTSMPEENTTSIQKKPSRKKDRKKKCDIKSNVIDESNFLSSKILDHNPSIVDEELCRKEKCKNEQKTIATTSENSKSNTEYIQTNSIASLNEFETAPKPTKRRGRPPKQKNILTPTCKESKNALQNETIGSEGEINVSKRTPRRNKKKGFDCTTHKSLRNDEVSTDIKQDCDSEKQQSIDKKCATSLIKEANISEPIQTKENMSDNKSSISDDDIEDLPLVAFSTKNTKTKHFADTVDNLKLGTEMEENKVLNNFTSNTEEQLETKIIITKTGNKKRGRPKKRKESKSTDQQIYKEDNINLSKLKDSSIISDDTNISMIREYNKEAHIQNLEENTEINSVSKRYSKKPVLPDYEYNIDTIVSSEVNNDITDEVHISDSHLVESSRPVRRKAKKNLHYDEGSDEDPFANVELSDDEPRRHKRGGRFHSDDEYIPDGKRSGKRESELTDTDTNVEEEVVDDLKKHRKKKYRKSNLGLQKSPKKISKQNVEDTSGLNDNVDVELNLETSVIRIDDDKKCEQNSSWGATNEFENFLAKIVQGTDIKIKKANSIDSSKTPLQIPTIDPNEEKKNLEVSSQTDKVKTTSISVQTNTRYEIPMKNQVSLTVEQSQKAAEFLSGIVKTTSDLGQLMTEKSDDFIAKKINTSYLTDTFKMDYCVKKSFLLFTLAKHNLIQMEEDLSKQYEKFLKETNLIQHREDQKVITSTPKDNDSDCEIVEEPVKKKAKEKIPFNPKTVFLNKELSIKIAKKTAETPKPKEKINIKGRHTVWINDSVMVKKVKPTQSFLAQDSRNKKPPDTFITEKMVSDFFKMYEHQKAVSLCAPYINNIFFQGKSNYICNYFFETTSTSLESYVTPSAEVVNYNEIESDLNRPYPDSLLSICMKVLQRVMNFGNIMNCKTYSKDSEYNDAHLANVTLQYEHDSDVSLQGLNTNIITQKRKIFCVPTLKNLCYKRIYQLIYVPNFSEYETEKVTTNLTEKNSINICENNGILHCTENCNYNFIEIKSLLSMCVTVLQNNLKSISKPEIVNTLHKVNSLKHLSLEQINKIINHNLKAVVCKSVWDRNGINAVKSLSLICMELISSKITNSCRNYCNVSSSILQSNENQPTQEISLKSISLEKIVSLMSNDTENYTTLNFTIDNVNTVSENIFLENSEYNDEHEITSLNDENYYSDNDLDANYQDDVNEETNWVAKVQMQELRSCVDLAKDNCVISKQNILEDSLVNIKIEPLDDFTRNTIDSSTVKIEPADDHENLQKFSPINIITKQEDVVVSPKPAQRKYSYDGDQFESFVTCNKMITDVVNYENEEIFSQSAHRIRRQYEPDSDDDIDAFSDTMNLLIPQSEETTMDRLMASSSDEGSSKKSSNKKKIDKRKPKTKKNKFQMNPTKEKNTEKIELLRGKMKKKIQIEETKKESEVDDVAFNLYKNDSKTTIESSSESGNHLQEKEIQCNDVDSTEHIFESQNEQKNKVELTPFFSADEPIELLQCTPSIISEKCDDEIENHVQSNNKACTNTNITYTNKQGPSCYPLDGKDSKIYQYAYIPLNKLPESFVETYNKYQSISAKSYLDSKIDKLTNLHRTHTKGNIRKTKNIFTNKFKSHTTKVNNNFDSEITPEQYQELSLSGDEDDTVDDNIVDYDSPQNSENNLAKNLLMNNDREGLKIKEEPKDEMSAKTRSGRVIKPTRRSGVEGIRQKPENLMLTADKVMDKDLRLLHAPIEVEFKQELIDAQHIDKKPNTRNSNKNLVKSNVVKIRIKDEDASSSEEEKQWFTTKEKLLKRLGKKMDAPSMDDAKRAKIVSEFIEKRNDGIETTRKRSRPRRRSKKKILERRKQMKILSRELFGDESHTGKKYQSQAYSKGRRNIRKVLDKKSLARSTVLANMDEFERKRRQIQREAQLREVLGCEEGVNVVVINDELCLEYDFENKLPLVTVHSFFTSVMKAHQYEGVKFMWDACFESVSATARGGGGGCILAHCMGLGKTLQVLALLHTVLTHPQLSMRRVLVCCPLSTVLNWVDEINKWIGPVTNKIKVFELSKLKKTYERAYQLEDWYNGGGIFIIGYELFRSLTTLDPIIDCVRPTIVNKIRTALLDPGPDIVVCDEGHLLKNDSSVLAVAMSRVVTKRRIILTGTPMQNNLREYYCMVNFVKPNLLGTYSEYSNRFENPIMNGQHRDSREEDIKLMKARTHILHKVLEGCLQRQEASVLYPYLPKKHEYTVFISQSKCQFDLYKHYLTNYTKGTKQSVLKDFHVLQKIWTHPQVLHSFLTRARGDEKEVKIKAEKMEDDLAREDLIASEDIKPSATETWWLPYLADSDSLDSLESSNKFLVVFHLLDECLALDDKVLIFSTSLYTMDSLEYFLRRIKQWNLGKEYYRLDGSVPAEVRQKWCREFNAPNNTTTKLFLISTRAGSLGLNMTAANRVIILDTSWNPAHDIQSIFRVYRFGQKKDCYIYRLVALGTMEQKMYERSVTKQAVACRVVDEQQIDRHYNMAELSELYRLDEDGYSVPAGLAPGIRDGVLLRVARTLGTTEGPGEVNARLHAVHEHDSLLRGSGETGLPEHERNAAWMQFQQEHSSTHNKIQNIEIKIPSVQKDENDQTDIEIKEEPTDRPKRNNPRSKKNKKNVDVEDATVLPSTSAQISPYLEPDLEEETVKKIMNILIKHKFHESKGPIEIPELVKKVRNVVANIDETGLENVDPLTASIAKVLIYSERKAVNDTKTRDINGMYRNDDIDVKPSIEVTVSFNEPPGADNPPESEKKRKKLKSDSDEEYVPEGTSRAVRKKKKNKSLDKHTNKKFSETSVSDAPTNSVQPVYHTILMQAAQSLPSEENLERENVNLNNKDTAMAVNSNANEISIILSDDESDEPVQKKPEQVPLHKSLLSNKNFIKIVAHTYLSVNNKLDEDAAMLAAQYSTFKALKEVEVTGKDLVSGPIYDIAVKVLGKAILEKLQSIHAKKPDGVIDLNEETSLSISSILSPNEATTSSQVDKTEVTTQLNSDIDKSTPKTHKKAKKPNILRDKESESSLRIGSALSGNMTVNSPVPTEVVPVGMFKGPASFQPSEPPAHEECILPDDDDIIFTDSISVATKTPLHINRLNSEIVVTTVSSNSKPQLAMSSTEITKKKIGPKSKINAKSCTSKIPTTQPPKQIVNNTVLNNLSADAVPSSNQSSEKPNETICLDSDEEETIVPTPKPKAKALKSTTKLPFTSQSSLMPKATNSQTVLNIATKKKITPPNNINSEQNAVRRPSDASSVAKNIQATPKPKKIIRITEGGKIEILRRTDNVPASSSSVITKADKNKPTIQKAERTPFNNTSINTVNVQNVSDSDDESPLSVIQNVIHIHADEYEEVNKANTNKESETISPIVIQDNMKSIKIKINKPPSTEIKKTTVNNVNAKNKIVMKVPSNTASTSKKDDKVIDLTESFLADKKILLVKKKDWDKMSGPSKDIIINEVGTLYNTATTASTAVTITNKTAPARTKTTSLLKVTPSGSVKRLSAVQETTAKRKPDPKKPMLLQDFDIDDIDDIIELE